MKNFELDPKLKKDTLFMTNLELCTVLLMNDERFPWLILVPKKPDVTELYALTKNELYQLLIEIKTASTWLQKNYQPDKLNVASIGNIVSQLHIHIVARYQTDPVWPQPVFGQGVAVPYSDEKIATLIGPLKNQFPLIMKDILEENK